MMKANSWLTLNFSSTDKTPQSQSSQLKRGFQLVALNMNSKVIRQVLHCHPENPCELNLNLARHILGHARHLRRVPQHRQGGGAHDRRKAQDSPRSPEGVHSSIPASPPSHPGRLPVDRSVVISLTALHLRTSGESSSG